MLVLIADGAIMKLIASYSSDIKYGVSVSGGVYNISYTNVIVVH